MEEVIDRLIRVPSPENRHQLIPLHFLSNLIGRGYQGHGQDSCRGRGGRANLTVLTFSEMSTLRTGAIIWELHAKCKHPLTPLIFLVGHSKTLLTLA